jgi:hypothetical protein
MGIEYQGLFCTSASTGLEAARTEFLGSVARGCKYIYYECKVKSKHVQNVGYLSI